MVFSSTIFLFAFLPATIVAYYTQKLLLQNRLRNAVLLVFSYLFYLYGSTYFIFILIGSTLMDYILGLFVERYRRTARFWLGFSITINLSLLIYFKYTNFAIGEFNQFLGIIGRTSIEWQTVILPLGISFFTFQKLSYVIDIYRHKTEPFKDPFDFALYVAMFPQLVAGPIVRFRDIREQIQNRRESWEQFYAGTLRFCWGLGKKVIVADACGKVADSIFSLPVAVIDTKIAWLGAVSYTLQIYFDFSAYSDMAIGLAMLFGFKLRENFNRPYISWSMTEFWQRWHISLSRWFKDYLYIPLGGNRKGEVKTYLNLIIVFSLCGLWHGANWTFILWGLYHGIFLILERITGLRDLPEWRWPQTRRLLTLIIVIVGWVLFRCEDVVNGINFIKNMFIWRDLNLPFDVYMALNWRNVTFLIVGAFMLVIPEWLPRITSLNSTDNWVRTYAGVILILLLLPYCTALIISGSSNPFIYYRF